MKLPAHNLEGLVQFGYPGASPAAMELCSKLGITISFLNPHGRFLARVEGPQSGNILLRRQQYRMYFDSDESIKLSATFITAKIINSKQVLSRAKRDYPDRMCDKLDDAIDKLNEMEKRAYNCCDEDILRGIEGDAARTYFGKLDMMLFVDKDNFFINNRNNAAAG